MKQLVKYSILFIIGGMSYLLIEILWRGHSHIAMFIVGGLCFIVVGLINEYYFKYKKSLLIQQAISCLVITLIELVFGLILNISLGLHVWDYSNYKFNFMGQICLTYSIFWFFLSLPTIIFYDYLRYWLFREKKPYYKFI